MLPSLVHAGFSRTGAHTLVYLLLFAAHGTAHGAGGQEAGGSARERHADPAIGRALALLPEPIGVPIEVLAPKRLAHAERRLLRRVCAFVRPGVRRIHVLASCPAYRFAGHSLLEAIKLAAILRHERAHLDGADEAAARRVEAMTVRRLVARAPADDFLAGTLYAAELQRVADAPNPR